MIACGGDGTVHAVLQGLVGTETALGVIPLGTANALASNLGLVGPARRRGAEKPLASVPVRIPVGRIHYQSARRQLPPRATFLLLRASGRMPLLMSRLDSRLKQRFGYALYLVEAARIWATHNFPLFYTGSSSPMDLPSASLPLELFAVPCPRSGSSAAVTGARRDPAQRLAPSHRLRNAQPTRLFQIPHWRACRSPQVHPRDRALRIRPCGMPRPQRLAGNPLRRSRWRSPRSLPVRLEVVPHAVNLLIPPGVEA